MKVRLGFSVPAGEPVDLDPQHLGITGLTQQSGKTTALEALMDRAHETAIAFRTGRGELGFHHAKRIAPYFRERTDWRFVEGLISAHLMEKAKFYRSDLIRLTRGTHNLGEVHANIKAALTKARPGSFPEKILTELNEYLVEIREALESVRFDPAPNLTPMALSVMDLEGLSPAVQQLVIAATVDWLMEGHLAVPVIVVLPEARDFIPEDRRTPAKLSLEGMIRKGAKVGRYLWLDSQALTGLDMDVCRSIGTWLFGRQQLDLESRRVVKMVPGRRVKADDVTGLKLGEFILVRGETVETVYVQPTWMGSTDAMNVAMGRASREKLRIQLLGTKEKQDMEEEERKEYDDRVKRLEDKLSEQALKIRDLMDQVKTEHDRAEANARAAVANANEALKARTIADLHRSTAPPDAQLQITTTVGGKTSSRTVVASDGTPVPATASTGDPPYSGPGTKLYSPPERIDLHVERETPNLTVHVKEVRIEATEKDNQGRMGILIADGFFDHAVTTGPIGVEYVRRGWMTYNPVAKGGGSYSSVKAALEKMCAWGFLTRPGAGDAYEVVAEARKRIRVVKEQMAA